MFSRNNKKVVRLDTLSKGASFWTQSGKHMRLDREGNAGLLWAIDYSTGRQNCYVPCDLVFVKIVRKSPLLCRQSAVL